MDWQEYQLAVAELYKKAAGIGTVQKNFSLPDKVTGQPRQIDCWVDVTLKGGHSLGVLIDAKRWNSKIDVKEVESVFAEATAVGANKAIIVCSNGWTTPAEIKAKSLGMDLRLWTVEDALGFYWMLCPVCGRGLVFLEDSSAAQISGGLLLWWLAGRCEACRGGVVQCQDCGEQLELPYGETRWCGCGHMWRFGKRQLQVYPKRQ